MTRPKIDHCDQTDVSEREQRRLQDRAATVRPGDEHKVDSFRRLGDRLSPGMRMSLGYTQAGLDARDQLSKEQTP